MSLKTKTSRCNMDIQIPGRNNINLNQCEIQFIKYQTRGFKNLYNQHLLLFIIDAFTTYRAKSFCKYIT